MKLDCRRYASLNMCSINCTNTILHEKKKTIIIFSINKRIDIYYHMIKIKYHTLKCNIYLGLIVISLWVFANSGFVVFMMSTTNKHTASRTSFMHLLTVLPEFQNLSCTSLFDAPTAIIYRNIATFSITACVHLEGFKPYYVSKFAHKLNKMFVSVLNMLIYHFQ